MPNLATYHFVSNTHTSILANNHHTNYGAQRFEYTSIQNQAVSEGKIKTLSSCHGHEFLCTDRYVFHLTRTSLANCKATADIVQRILKSDNMRVFGFLTLNINCITWIL